MLVVSRSRTRARPIVVVLLLVSLTLFVIDQAGENAPTHAIRSFVHDSLGSVRSGADKVWSSGDSKTVAGLRTENEQLRAQLDEANGKLSQVSDVQRQNKELSDILHLPVAEGTQKIVAGVVSMDTSNFDSSIEINRGSNDGIKSGMPVVSGQGLVGRVVKTSNTSSIVMLITDATSNVSVRFADAGDIGVAMGQGEKKALSVDLIDLDSKAKQGELVVTSGADKSLFPAGIAVGRIESTTEGAQNLRRDVRVKPIVDFNKLQNIAVLKSGS